jgi:hypothetical protein
MTRTLWNMLSVANKSVSQSSAKVISSTDWLIRVPSADLLTDMTYKLLISKDILFNEFDLT